MTKYSEYSSARADRGRPREAAASEFASESELAAAVRGPRNYRRLAAVVVGGLLLSASVVAGLTERAVKDATLAVESDPIGADVRIDGKHRGKTPLTIALTPGTYTVLVGDGDASKERRIILAAAERASMYLERADVDTVVPPLTNGALSVVTEPAGGRISVDGTDRGAAPLVIHDLAAGEHRVVVRSQGVVVYQQTVRLEAGATSTVFAGATTSVAGGWLEVQSPLRLQIYEGARLVGTTDTDRLMLPTGDHQLTFSDEHSGFGFSRAVRITAGATTNVAVQIPKAPVNVNAIPWAEVWFGNERLGETPIANYMLPLGSHQIELRHPQLGTRRATVSVSMNGANRLAVNMRER